MGDWSGGDPSTLPTMSDTRRALSLGHPISFGAAGAIEKRVGAFRRHWPLEGERLLDVGCGNGAYTVAMAEAFAEVHGIEIESERLEEFRAYLAGSPLKGKVHAHEMSAEQLEFDDGTFDVVTAIEVIEHIIDLPCALREMRRVLKADGALLVTCPNRLFPFETHSVLVRDREYSSKYIPLLPYLPPLHRRISTARNFSVRELNAIMTAEGFRKVAIDYIMPPFDRLAVARQVVKPITERLERSRLKIFGVSIVGIYARG